MSEQSGQDQEPILDYRAASTDDAVRKPMHEGVAGALIGAGALGCLVPLLLAVFCALVLNDIGGPLFWPIIMMFGVGVGLAGGAIVGCVVRMARKRRGSITTHCN